MSAPTQSVPAVSTAGTVGTGVRGRIARVRALLGSDKLFAAGIAIIVFVIFIAIFAPVLAPYPADGGTATDPVNTLLPPSAQHWFGTDVYGRDILSRFLFGARTTLLTTFVVLATAGSVGVILGIIAGFFGGWINNLVLRITDVFLALPSLLLCLALSLALGPGLWTMITALAVTWWPWYTRIAATTAASITGRGYILSARALGVSRLRIALAHVLPNAAGPVLAQISLNAGSVSLASAGLAYLGLGASEPVPEWGLMVQQGQTFLTTQPWVSAFPGIGIIVIAFAFNMIGEGLRTRIGSREERL